MNLNFPNGFVRCPSEPLTPVVVAVEGRPEGQLPVKRGAR